MKLLKLSSLGISMTLLMSLSVPSVFADGKGADALVTVTVNSGVISNAVVNMYDITLLNNEYVGQTVATLSTGSDGKGAVFTVKPGEVVDFMAFGNAELAAKSKAFVSNGVPPLKNFSVDDGVAGICHTNGIDFNAKLQVQANIKCWNELNLQMTGDAAVDMTNSQKAKGKKVSYKATVIDGTGMSPTADPVLLPNTFVNMYEITLKDNAYVGKLIKTLATGKKGKSAIFTIKPGQVVDFMAFGTKKAANKTKTFVSNGVPPMKNFSPDYNMPGLCHTNGVLFDEKLLGWSDKTMCGKSGQYELTK